MTRNYDLTKLIRKHEVITVCVEPECQRIRFPQDMKWSDNYNHKKLNDYDRLSHTYCPEHYIGYMKKHFGDDYDKQE